MTEVAPVESLIQFIQHTAELLQELQASQKNLFEADECVLLCESFLKQTSPSTLYIIQTDTYTLKEELPTFFQSAVALIKSKGAIRNDCSIVSQIYVLNIPKTNDIAQFETIRSLVNLGISPYFELVSQNSDQTSVSTARKKLKELSLTLQHLQQHIHIPDLLSTVHAKLNDNDYTSIDQIPDELLHDTSFLNELTTISNNWVKQIQSVSSLSHKPSDGNSVMEEILFWRSMNETLTSLTQQINDPKVKLTLDILKRAKRYHVTMSFTNETGLEDKLIECNDYNTMLKDFPIDDIISISSANPSLDILESLKEEISKVFNHFKKLKNFPNYPILRAVELVEVVLMDICTKLTEILSQFFLMSLSMKEFRKVLDKTILVFDSIDESIKSTTNLFRELLRKRQEKFIIIKIEQKMLNDLKDRLNYLYNFRNKHNNLLRTIEIVNKTHQSDDAAQKLIDCYNQLILPINAVDISQIGSNIWTSNESMYETVYQDCQNNIVNQINVLLENCTQFNDFLSVLSVFENENNEIMELIDEEHKIRCMSLVDQSIEQLIVQNRSNKKSIEGISDFYNVHGLVCIDNNDSSIVEKLLWMTSVKKSVMHFKAYLETLFGDHWHQYSIGTKINTEANSLLHSLEPEKLLNEWVENTNQKMNELIIDGPIFKVNSTNDSLEIDVSFDTSLLLISSEIHQLIDMGFKIPSKFMSKINSIDKLYPFISDLKEHLTMLQNILNIELKNSEYGQRCQFVLDESKENVYNALDETFDITWALLLRSIDLEEISESKDELKVQKGLSNFEESKALLSVKSFMDATYSLFSNVSLLRNFYTTYKILLKTLEETEFTHESIKYCLTAIQEKATQFTYLLPQNMDALYNILNEDVAKILTNKVEFQINQAINNESNIFSKEKISILYEDQEFSLSPTFAKYRNEAFDKINNILRIATNHTILSNSETEVTFGSILDEKPATASRIYEFLESIIEESQLYFKKWLKLQEMWENSIEDLKLELGENLDLWLSFLTDARKLKSLFDTSGSSVIIGCGRGTIELDYSLIQSRVSAKYEDWQIRLLHEFSVMLQKNIESTQFKLAKLYETSSEPINFGSTPNIIKAIIENDKFDRSIGDWTSSLDKLKQSQNILQRSRHKFTKEWLYVEQLENKHSIICTLFERKSKLINDHLELISSRLIYEAKRVEGQMQQLKEGWEAEKPISGSIKPQDAIEILHRYERKCSTVVTDKNNVVAASDSLSTHIVILEDVIEIENEVKDLLSIWLALDSIWEGLNILKTLQWIQISPRDIRKQLEDLLNTVRTFPAKVRQYSAFDTVHELIKSHLKSHSIVTELKTDAMKARHWLLITKELNIEAIPYDKMTLGDVWNMNLILNQSLIRTVLKQANMELVIEENISSIEKSWSSHSFNTFNYKNKYRLIKGWDALFDQCNNDLVALSNMKNSLYYSNFETAASELENKLNSLFAVLDVWVEVQREWIYLDGVFTSNKDIPQLIPVEFSRFNNITHEFFSFLKQASKYSLVIDVLKVPEIHEIITRLLESLQRIRRSLNDFLEKQRKLFPRFYFIGNEDMLQIIGSGNNVKQMGQFFKKMYSGINGVEYNENDSSIIGVYGDLGEHFILNKPVSLLRHTRLHEWLLEFESEVRTTLSILTGNAIEEFIKEDKDLSCFISNYPLQVIILACQVNFTSLVNDNFLKIKFHETYINEYLNQATKNLQTELAILERKKYESLITEFLHQKKVIEELELSASHQDRKYIWNVELQYYYNKTEPYLSRLKVKQADAEFEYAFEYLAITDRLAHTPLTNKCFLTMTQALSQGLGAFPYGPAGTGKTETVKALGHNLGRMVIVFCCDEYFDFQSMGRIFLGLCKVGVWGCFDEFNRLDEHIISAVSTQIENIESGLISSANVMISGKHVNVHPNTGLFITMNPDYAGRSELPENLKKLFRSVSMKAPDSQLIVEILLTAGGFSNASSLSDTLVKIFKDMINNIEPRIHYDFGLRALKSTLNACSMIKLEKTSLDESEIIVRGMHETIYPKLLKKDVDVVNELLQSYFPNISYKLSEPQLVSTLKASAAKYGYEASEEWLKKCLQIYGIQSSNHGLILVGETGSGKSSSWKLLLESLSLIDKQEHISIIIDCKVMSKDNIYGKLDNVTREWIDGLFTSILRKINQNSRGELNKRIWIVFDGDIDPEWVENLNSVLDDNKILTLPNGERIDLPNNVRLLFEVENLKYTTPATISRCGMVWFGTETISLQARYRNFISRIRNNNITDAPKRLIDSFVDHIEKTLSFDVFNEIVEKSQTINHIMEFSIVRYFETLTTLLQTHYRKLVNHLNEGMECSNLPEYVNKVLILSLIWTFSGDSYPAERETLGQFITNLETFKNVESIEGCHLDYYVDLSDASWKSWIAKVENIELEPHQVSETDTVISTLDTLVHEDLIYSILNEHRPFVLCGPPGSGKTMILLESLRKSPDLDMLSLNFSKETSPELLIKSLESFCRYKTTNSGVTLVPKVTGKWVVVFCDEINLPDIDKYGTQRVISLLRQMIEQGGFWRSSDKVWVTLKDISFVGACNPPTDPGRNEISKRFLRQSSLIVVDYPGETSLKQIYQTFNLAIMKFAPNLRGFTSTITDAMIHIYGSTRAHFNASIQKHYIYSPRELTRWSKGILEALKRHQYSELNHFLRLFYHEGLRLFYDRLVSDEHRQWTLGLFKATFEDFFPHLNINSVMESPVLFSDWLSKDYISASRTELMSFVTERLRVFSEEDIEVNLILYDDMLDHILRIDRVLRQPQGHMILVGASSSGKATLTRFVSWIHGIRVVQLNVFTGYSLSDFDSTLRSILLDCASGDKICFIIDESTIVEAAFIERMNTLLANAEIPGLFEGEDFKHLMKICHEESMKQGLYLDSDDELYKWFAHQITKTLHVVFTISGTSPGFLTSPALFNRCVLNWMGNWSSQSLFAVSKSLIDELPFDLSRHSIPESYKSISQVGINGLRDIFADCLVAINNVSLQHDVSYPNLFLSFVNKFKKIFLKSLNSLEENQNHINVGLDKLRETVIMINSLKEELSSKKLKLEEKDKEARKMLSLMLSEQNEAERKREFSIETQAELQKQELEIENRKSKVMKDLALAEPAVLEAQRGVQNIKKQHLTELRSMSNPPAAVKMTLESVCILLGYEVSTWREVQLVVRKDDFIANIVSFDNSSQLSSELRYYMENAYLSRDDYNFEAVNRASKACGPLVQWVVAQLAYSSVLENIGPLRQEVVNLEQQTDKTKTKLIAIDQMIDELEQNIEESKLKYTEVIRSTENIKSEMETISLKVQRSLKLIENLTSERERWKSSIKKFGHEREVLIGSSILAAAFSVYSGNFDQNGREKLMKSWKSILTVCGIPYDSSLIMSTYFISSTPSLGDCNLNLSDELSIENFALIQSSKFPFIIDPLSKSIDFLKSQNSKLVVTSFLDANFVQRLENAIRFGGSILIQDAELYNSILNPVLREEVYKQGGRSVISIKDQDIDYSPNFKMYLHTKDPSVFVSSFVQARTTIVNFTTTKSSLENEVLAMALTKKRPDIEEKRKELTILQSRYKNRLFNLESELLISLNDTSGSVLDDNNAISRLEELKREANEIDSKISESESVIETVENIRFEYNDIARHSSSIYGIMKSMSKLSDWYNFSLEEYSNIYDIALDSPKDNIVLTLYQETYARISLSMLSRDKIIFALRLAISYFTLEESQDVEQSLITIFKALSTNDIKELKEILKDQNFTSDEDDGDKESALLVIRRFVENIIENENESRNLAQAIENFTSFLFTGVGSYSSKYDFQSFISNQHKPQFPILMNSLEGLDPSFIVKSYANKTNHCLKIISMGSKEEIECITSDLEAAIVEGGWLLLQNIQMSMDWLNRLNKIIEIKKSDGFHKDFKLFLTASITSKLPTSIISQSMVLVFDDKTDFKSRFKELFDTINFKDDHQSSAEKQHVFLILAWMHCLIIERLAYSPLGFTKYYDINMTEFIAGCHVVNTVFKQLKASKINISPDTIPWEYLKFMIAEITYGGKLDNDTDLLYIKSLANSLFTVKSFEYNFNLIDNQVTAKTNQSLNPPEGVSEAAYQAWMESLPSRIPPSWLGLEDDIIELLEEERTKEAITKTCKFLE